MKVTLFLKPDRVVFIVNEFPEAVIDQSETDFTKVEFEVNGNYDLLKIFHAGIHCGQDYIISYGKQDV